MLLKFKLRRATFTLTLACVFCSIAFTSVASAVDYRKLAFEMFDAAREGNIEAVEKILDQNVPIESRNRFGNTALIYAVRGGHMPLVKKLVALGANVNKPNLNGKTPLMEAAIKGNMELARYLIGLKADVNAKTMENFNALIFATYYKHSEMAHLLLDQGADTKVLDNSDKPALVMPHSMEMQA